MWVSKDLDRVSEIWMEWVSEGPDRASEGLEGGVNLLLSVSPHSRLLVSFPVAFVFLVCGNSGSPG